MRILEFVHDQDHPVEQSNIDLWVQNNVSCKTEKIWVNKNVNFPGFESYDLIILHGGVQHLWDKDADPWLYREIQYIKEALGMNKPVIGFCLGSQIIAEALCEKVYAAKQEEMGFFKIIPGAESKGHELLNGLKEGFTSFEWHSDHYNLPDGCVSLASTKAAENQVFLSNQVPAIGFQFHPEYTKEIIKNSLESFSHNRWNIDGRELDKQSFLKELETMPETYCLFNQLMNNSLRWLFKNTN